MMPGFWQVILVLLIVLILFGAGKLPKVMGDIAKGVRSFRAGLKEDSDEEAEQGSPKVLESEASPQVDGTQRSETAPGQTHAGQTHTGQPHPGQTHKEASPQVDGAQRSETAPGQTHAGQTHTGQPHPGQTHKEDTVRT